MLRSERPTPAMSSPNSCATPFWRRNWKQRLALAVGGVLILAACVAVRLYNGDAKAGAQTRGWFGLGKASKDKSEGPKRKSSRTGRKSDRAGQSDTDSLRPQRPEHDVMAIVNGKDINRHQLAHACIERFGEEVLESLVNKRLILHHCRNRNIEVTQEEIDAEIDRMAKRFKLGREQWLNLLEKERGINPQEYARDILWPTLALEKLVADELTVSEQELRKAHTMRYGPAVRARLIVVSDRALAEQLHRQLVNRPDEFARLAMAKSEDVNSASIGGLIQPIRRHMGDPEIEREVFSLKTGQISKIIPVAEQFAILKCEGHMPARNVPLEKVRGAIVEQIKESKLRDVASEKFAELQSAATVQNVWNNPELRERMPGIVALVNGEQITVQELGEECVLRYGEEVLEAEISHVLLQQELTDEGLTVTQQDIDAEIAHAATLSGVVDANGRPDLDKWIQMVTEEQEVSRDAYLRDSVWPSAALKKLTGNVVQVTEDDIRKGFDANYGQRVRCRAIVLHNMRQAMEVWGKARQNDSMEYFGDLAEEYSVEPTSKSLRGEVPPIRRYGGQHQLEEAAFSLQPGQLSEIIQMGGQFIILKCEGRTEPVEVELAEVRNILVQDIREKKLRVAMSQRYDKILEQARIDNYLAGTSKDPKASPDGTPGAAGTPVTQRIDTAVQPAAATSRQ